ncbi:hypothetical protein BP6252_08499 [Coleophoma cylindrospora]|uniref:Rho GDP-dissociation inhibitor n=1 Tax=Coleophoma cylindrospora TaxID=1849047 RepID=A0A3D8R610_9HELO|nr:hypothetical protein BP6252_08499 [Coleophoma cylindrospora]
MSAPAQQHGTQNAAKRATLSSGPSQLFPYTEPPKPGCFLLFWHGITGCFNGGHGQSRIVARPGDLGASHWQAPNEWRKGPDDPRKLVPSISLPHLFLDAEDDSLQRYKESLGLGGQGNDISDPNDKRVCIILSLTMETTGRDPVTIDLSQEGSAKTLKDNPFKIKEGAKFNMVAKFKVQHEVLSGLQYVQIVKRKGVRVSKDQEMIGSYAPNTDKTPFYTKRFADEDAPSGMLARGHYTAVSTFVDDDKHKHLEFEWSFDIAKDW